MNSIEELLLHMPIKIILISSLILLILFTISSCLNFRTSDKKFLKKFAEEKIGVKIAYHPFEDKQIRLIHSYPIDNTKPTIFYVHGAPGSNDNYLKLMKDPELNKISNWVSVDRLGYGYSEIGKAETSIAQQSKSLLTVFEPYFEQSPFVLLLGWSYGGPIVSKMALDNPNPMDHVIMLAPAIDPEHEKYFFMGKLAQWFLTRWLVPKPFRVAQDEKVVHVEELDSIKPNWKNLKVPVTNVHGNSDGIVPYENLNFVNQYFPKETTKSITLKGMGHLFPISQPEVAKQIILDVLEEYGYKNQD